MTKQKIAPAREITEGEVREIDNYRIRHALVVLIRLNGGQKEFARSDYSPETFRYLVWLEANGFIEEISTGGPVSCTYRLKQHP